MFVTLQQIYEELFKFNFQFVHVAMCFSPLRIY